MQESICITEINKQIKFNLNRQIQFQFGFIEVTYYLYQIVIKNMEPFLQKNSKKNSKWNYYVWKHEDINKKFR